MSTSLADNKNNWTINSKLLCLLISKIDEIEYNFVKILIMQALFNEGIYGFKALIPWNSYGSCIILRWKHNFVKIFVMQVYLQKLHIWYRRFKNEYLLKFVCELDYLALKLRILLQRFLWCKPTCRKYIFGI